MATSSGSLFRNAGGPRQEDLPTGLKLPDPPWNATGPGHRPDHQHPSGADFVRYNQQPPEDEPVLDPEWELADLADFFGVDVLF